MNTAQSTPYRSQGHIDETPIVSAEELARFHRELRRDPQERRAIALIVGYGIAGWVANLLIQWLSHG